MTGIPPAHAGRRGELIAMLKRAADLAHQMRGCRLYLISEDEADDSLAVVFEMWNDQDAHDDPLNDPRVKELIAEAREYLAGTPKSRELRVVGGLRVE